MSEQHPKSLLHHLFLLFFLRGARTEKGGTLARLSRCPGRKRYRFPARLAKRTRPALNRNQLADRSPQINIICK
jgi:hypothetical protein